MHRACPAAFSLAVMAAMSADPLPGQATDRCSPVRAVMPKSIANALLAAPSQDRVVLKLAERRPELVASDAVVAPDVLRVLGGRAARPYFEGLETQLAEIRRRQLAATRAGETPPVDLALYFEVVTAGGEDTRTLVRELNALDSVELAYPRPLAAPPPGDIPPTTPDFTAFQGFRGAAPSGIDAHAAMSTTGGMGAGIIVHDIEYGWELQHEDIAALRASSVIGPPFGPQFGDHGTAVAGIIAADPDTYGVTGIAPDSTLQVTTSLVFTLVNVAGAIATALPTLNAGDVILIEQQTQTPLGYGPVEWTQAEFDAILIATNLGVITVEAAGNGSVDLDSPVLGGLFDLNVRDSGALIIGGSAGGISARYGQSTYGSRIDANGWASWVTTTGYGTMFGSNDPRQGYVNAFGGTSAASAILAAVVAALRGAATAQLDPAQAAALDMFAIRTLLRTTGTPVPFVGNRPDCRSLFAAAGIDRGLTIRSEPRTGQACHIDLTVPFTPTSNDLWALAGSFGTTNQPMPVGMDGRILLASPATPLGLGGLTSSTATRSFTIPNSSSMRGLRYFFQAFTYETATGTLSATNGVQLFVRT